MFFLRNAEVTIQRRSSSKNSKNQIVYTDYSDVDTIWGCCIPTSNIKNILPHFQEVGYYQLLLPFDTDITYDDRIVINNEVHSIKNIIKNPGGFNHHVELIVHKEKGI
jgi:hypothetical protein